MGTIHLRTRCKSMPFNCALPHTCFASRLHSISFCWLVIVDFSCWITFTPLAHYHRSQCKYPTSKSIERYRTWAETIVAERVFAVTIIAKCDLQGKTPLPRCCGMLDQESSDIQNQIEKSDREKFHRNHAATAVAYRSVGSTASQWGAAINYKAATAKNKTRAYTQRFPSRR